MRRNTAANHAAEAFSVAPVMEGQLKAEVESGALDAALTTYDRLLRRLRRTPHSAVCTSLLELCVTQGAISRALYVLETMGEVRTLDVDDYCRIVRLLILKRVRAEDLARFEETASKSSRVELAPCMPEARVPAGRRLPPAERAAHLPLASPSRHPHLCRRGHAQLLCTLCDSRQPRAARAARTG
jgi:hypothetical protein